MSSILKALKKLEDEKSALEEERPIRVTRQMLQQEPKRMLNRTLLWFGALAAAVLIAIVWVALLNRTAIREPVKIAAPAVTANTGNTPPQPAVEQILPSLRPNVPVTRPEPPTQSQYRAADEPPALPRQTKSSQDTLSRPELPGNQPPPAVIPHNRAPAESQAAQKFEQPDASLTLSGIAWNKDSADRLAIINGQPSATGSMVNGSRVEEILPDRVRLSKNGTTFEIILGRPAKSN